MYFDQVSLASTYTGQFVLVTPPPPEFYKPKHSRLCLHCNSYFMVVYVGKYVSRCTSSICIGTTVFIQYSTRRVLRISVLVGI